jgi:hypothetical protein
VRQCHKREKGFDLNPVLRRGGRENPGESFLVEEECVGSTQCAAEVGQAWLD